ncbi:hypothetical protein SEA_CASSITA_110 [Microbacterium phage Cassita]|nr:hypothetical protein SEA_CASSITA_110 [Microbacterium phage Cassita]
MTALRECVVCGEKATESNATEEWEKRHEHTEPQGEPSDAQIEAALSAYWGAMNVEEYGSVEGMRAALRAAQEAR